jgi:hypothetical protein
MICEGDEIEALPALATTGFHEKAVNRKLKFTSSFFAWVGVESDRLLEFAPGEGDSPRLPWGTGGEKSPEGI